MRGLGLGILITTIILSLGTNKEKLTDTEIMAKARELGMDMIEDEADDNLQKVIEKSLPSLSESDPPEQEDSSEIIEDDNSDNNIDITEDMVSDEDGDTDSRQLFEEDGTDSTELYEDDGTDDFEERVLDDEDINIDVSDELITFTIVRGMSSGQIAEVIQQKGLINDAVEFDNYIKQNGKASVLRVGTYNLSKEATYEDILRAITDS